MKKYQKVPGIKNLYTNNHNWYARIRKPGHTGGHILLGSRDEIDLVEARRRLEVYRKDSTWRKQREEAWPSADPIGPGSSYGSRSVQQSPPPSPWTHGTPTSAGGVCAGSAGFSVVIPQAYLPNILRGGRPLMFSGVSCAGTSAASSQSLNVIMPEETVNYCVQNQIPFQIIGNGTMPPIPAVPEPAPESLVKINNAAKPLIPPQVTAVERPRFCEALAEFRRHRGASSTPGPLTPKTIADLTQQSTQQRIPDPRGQPEA